MNEDLVTSNLSRILNIGVLLSAQRKLPKLLDTILTEAMEITCCDAGTLYLYEENMLHFKIMRNHTMKTYKGGADDAVELPPVPISEQNVCAYVVLHRMLENIEDVYSSHKFDFSGPRNYDKITGYRTKSMLVIPLENNRGEVVGVLQLINAMNAEGEIIPFNKDLEPIFCSIASQAAIAVTNMNYLKENRELFMSLVEVLAAAIDERSHYNANHTRNVAMLATGFMDYINQQHDCGNTTLFLPEEDRGEIIMAAWLHDVGKIITPLEIMDKATRLGGKEKLVQLRFDTIYAAEKIHFLEGKITEEKWNVLAGEILAAKELCAKGNSGAPTSEEELAAITALGQRSTILPTGEELFWLEPDEVESLAIRYGTLTAAERKIMEEHVVITGRLLKKIKFSSEYESVPFYAAGHHEKLNGRGYPAGLSEEELPLGTRILTILDVFEALTAKDRPYKPPMPVEKAFGILDKMIADGELDERLVTLLKNWQSEPSITHAVAGE